jgi:PD-(D/E)XK endonuclease
MTTSGSSSGPRRTSTSTISHEVGALPRATRADSLHSLSAVASLKQKGDLAELKVAADLIERGCKISIPFGEDSDYDLIADFEGRLHRVQVKFTKSDGSIVLVRCRSHSLTKGKVRTTKHYSSEMVDWIAVYDAAGDRCYYCPSRELGSGRSELRLRLVPARNGQHLGIRYAEAYTDPDFSIDPKMEPAGIEPATSCLQSTRSAN